MRHDRVWFCSFSRLRCPQLRGGWRQEHDDLPPEQPRRFREQWSRGPAPGLGRWQRHHGVWKPAGSARNGQPCLGKDEALGKNFTGGAFLRLAPYLCPCCTNSLRQVRPKSAGAGVVSSTRVSSKPGSSGGSGGGSAGNARNGGQRSGSLTRGSYYMAQVPRRSSMALGPL